MAPKQPTIVGPPKDGIGMKEGCKQNPNCASWILTIMLWYVLFSGLLCFTAFNSDEGGYCGSVFGNIIPFLCILVVVLTLYLVECGFSGTGKYLNNILQKEGASKFVERIKGIHLLQLYDYIYNTNVYMTI